MSWGLQVPEGWVKGEPLGWIGAGPRYACHPMRGPYEPMVEYMVTFDSKADADKFNEWWRADSASGGAMPCDHSYQDTTTCVHCGHQP